MNRSILWWIAAGHVVAAAICSPQGVPSGAWAVPWLADPDCLVSFASGAILAYPLLLIPLWAGLSRGPFWLRLALSTAFCVAILGGVALRGLLRDARESPALPMLLILLFFSLMTLCCWGIQQIGQWRIENSPGCQATSTASTYRPQFRLRHLLAGMTLLSCLLAFYRYTFPEGIPLAQFSMEWHHVAWLARAILRFVLIVMPSLPVAWFVLAVRGSDATSIGFAAAIVVCAAVFSGSLCWLANSPRGLGGMTGHEVLWTQSGAILAGMTSAFTLRFSGYRIVRVAAVRNEI